MKRSAQPSESRENKRVRRDGLNDPGPSTVDPFDPTGERRFVDLAPGRTEDNGFVTGRVRMKWPPSGGKLKVLMALADKTEFVVSFTGACSKYFHLLVFNIKDLLQLSLKGTVVEFPNRSKPMLQYELGVVVKFLETTTEGKAGEIIDTWDLERASQFSQPAPLQEPASDDWYATPAVPPSNPPFSKIGSVAPTGAIVTKPDANSAPQHTSLSLLLPSSGSGTADSSAKPSAVDSGNAPQRATPRVARNSSEKRRDVTVKNTPPPPPRDPNVTATSKDACSSHSTSMSAESAAQVVRKQAPTDPDVQISTTVRGVQPKPKGQKAPPSGGPPVQLPPPRPITEVITRIEPVKKSKKQEKREKKVQRRELRIAAEAVQKPTAAKSVSPTVSVPAKDSPNHSVGLDGERMEAGDMEMRPAAGPSSVTLISPTNIPAGNQDRKPSTKEDTITSQPKDLDVVLASANTGSHPLPEENPISITASTASGPFQSMPVPAPRSVSAVASTSKASFTPYHTTILSGSSSASTSTLPAKAENNDTKAMMRVLHTGSTRYIPLNQLVTRGTMYNIIGVVTYSNRISKTSRNEYMTKLTLADPSIFGERELSLNLFQARDGYLPEAKRGDIILLRGIHGDEYQGNICGCGKSFKPWTWGLLDPRTGFLGRAPASAAVGSVNFQPNELELTYCMQLRDWWRFVLPVESANETVHNVADMMTRDRVHRLICDASPHAPPNGFFDCTVEVLNGFSNPANDGHVYSLYVTDYTRNPSLPAVQRDWCPPALADQVLRVEMWGDATQLGATMKPGEYYVLGNNRMKLSGCGDVEATISEVRKIRKLDEDTLEGEPHFEALLSRKREWEAKVQANGGSEFPHLLIEQAEENKFFKCTVEVTSISLKDSMSFLYVTDYTARYDLVPVAPNAIASPAFQHHVLKIELYDRQFETSKNLEPGDCITILNLRLKPSSSSHKLAGRLGGNQSLINKLQSRGSTNEELKALFHRKTEWEKLQVSGKKKPKNSRSKQKTVVDQGDTIVRTTPITFTSTAATKTNKFPSIVALEACEECPAAFDIRARITDFYPEKLMNFTVLRCTKCGDDIPDSHRICTECDDAMDSTSFVRPEYRFFFMLEDEDGSQLKVSSSDPQCTLLEGLEPADFTVDDGALQAFTERLSPLLGNLMTVRDGVARRVFGDEEPNTPTLSLRVASWLADDNDKTSLRSYIILSHELAM